MDRSTLDIHLKLRKFQSSDYLQRGLIFVQKPLVWIVLKTNTRILFWKADADNVQSQMNESASFTVLYTAQNTKYIVLKSMLWCNKNRQDFKNNYTGFLLDATYILKEILTYYLSDRTVVFFKYCKVPIKFWSIFTWNERAMRNYFFFLIYIEKNMFCFTHLYLIFIKDGSA